MEVKDLGAIELDGSAIIADPIYTTDCKVRVTMLLGKYSVKIIYGELGIRVAAIVIIHEHFIKNEFDSWRRLGTVNIDSGQCGIYDTSIIPLVPDSPFISISDECSKITATYPTLAGVIKNGKGVISRTGFGAGVYDVFRVSNGEVLWIDYGIEGTSDIIQQLIGLPTHDICG